MYLTKLIICHFEENMDSLMYFRSWHVYEYRHLEEFHLVLYVAKGYMINFLELKQHLSISLLNKNVALKLPEAH